MAEGSRKSEEDGLRIRISRLGDRCIEAVIERRLYKCTTTPNLPKFAAASTLHQEPSLAG